ncbi:Metaxin-2 [Balamuthia mandrillaris]
MPHSLTAQERADVAAFSYLVQSKLHNIMLYNWWADKNNRGEISRLPHFNSTTFPLSVALPILRTRKVMQDLEITFHTLTDDHVYKEASACCRALSDRLGTDPYFHGSDRPGRLDAVVVGHLAVMLMGQLPNPKLREIVLQHNNLVRFCKRVLSEHLDVELDESKLASSSSGSTSAAAQSIFRQSYRKQGVVVLSLAGLALLGYYAAKRVSADDFASSVPLPSSSMTELLPS